MLIAAFFSVLVIRAEGHGGGPVRARHAHASAGGRDLLPVVRAYLGRE